MTLGSLAIVAKRKEDKMDYQSRHDGQVAHIREHIALFREHVGNDEVSTYLIDYETQYFDLYQLLCHDLNIEPRAELIHPNPYGEN